jgi:hypothetical protein
MVNRLKYFDHPSSKEANLLIEPSSNSNEIRITSALPIKGLIFYQETSDNALDVYPSEVRVLQVSDLKSLSWRHLGSRKEETWEDI